jgi:hypothetical protein
MDVIRFKDIFKQPPNEDGTPLSFQDMYTAEYRPGEDELTNYRAYRRRRVHDVGSDTATYSESFDFDEALNIQQRQKRARIMKRLKSRIKLGKDRAKRKMADKKKLETRANKQARNAIVKKITKGKSKKDLSFARRQEIEKRLDKPAMKNRIARLAKRMFPSIRRAEVQRKKG